MFVSKIDFEELANDIETKAMHGTQLALDSFTYTLVNEVTAKLVNKFSEDMLERRKFESTFAQFNKVTLDLIKVLSVSQELVTGRLGANELLYRPLRKMMDYGNGREFDDRQSRRYDALRRKAKHLHDELLLLEKEALLQDIVERVREDILR